MIIAKKCSIAIVKVGANGSYIRKVQKKFKVEAIPVKKVMDTTGAGDYFAAGFLVWTDLWIFFGEVWQDRFYFLQNVIQMVGTTIQVKEKMGRNKVKY